MTVALEPMELAGSVVRRGVALRELSRWRIGGSADLVIEPRDEVRAPSVAARHLEFRESPASSLATARTRCSTTRISRRQLRIGSNT